MKVTMTVFSKSNPFFIWETDAKTTKAAKLDALKALNLDNYVSKEEAYKDLYVIKVTQEQTAGVDYRWEK